MASGGSNLTEIKKTCDNVIAKLGSIGTCVTSCTVPGVGTLFQLPAEEMEFGVGVHGEAGAFRCKVGYKLITLNTDANTNLEGSTLYFSSWNGFPSTKWRYTRIRSSEYINLAYNCLFEIFPSNTNVVLH